MTRACGPDHRQRNVAPEQEERAVREIDDAHHPENQRQAAREQEQQGAVGNAVERLDHPEVGIHVVSRYSLLVSRFSSICHWGSIFAMRVISA
jgi:hypothetical protein